MKLIKILLLILIVGAVTISFFFLKKERSSVVSEKKPKPVAVEVFEVVSSDIKQFLELTGSVEPYHSASLASPAEGPVESIRVREGDKVREGQDIIKIGRKHGIDALIASLEEEMKKEKSNLERTEHLYKNNVIPVEKVEIARAGFEKTNAALIKAREQSGDYIIKAPWDGIVQELLVKEGEFLSPRQKLVTIYEPQTLIIKSTVYEKYAMSISEGDIVEITLDAYKGKKFNGVVNKVYPYLNSRLRTRPFEVGINQKIKLLPGMFARLSIILKEEKDTVVIPNSAIFTDKNGNYSVYVVEDGKAVSRRITKGIENAYNVQILKGISFKDKVIVNGIEDLKESTVVKIVSKDKNEGGIK